MNNTKLNTTQSSNDSPRFKSEPFQGQYIVYDTKTMEPYQKWDNPESAQQHADELNADLTDSVSDASTETQHTPGPWEVHPNKTNIYTATPTPNGRIAIADCKIGRHDEQQANARLIAAAPDYDSVARDFVSEWEGDDHESLPDFLERYAMRFREVMAKTRRAA